MPQLPPNRGFVMIGQWYRCTSGVQRAGREFLLPPVLLGVHHPLELSPSRAAIGRAPLQRSPTTQPVPVSPYWRPRTQGQAISRYELAGNNSYPQAKVVIANPNRRDTSTHPSVDAAGHLAGPGLGSITFQLPRLGIIHPPQAPQLSVGTFSLCRHEPVGQSRSQGRVATTRNERSCDCLDPQPRALEPTHPPGIRAGALFALEVATHCERKALVRM